MYRVLVPVDEHVDRARRQAEYVRSLPGADEVEATVLHAWTGGPDDVPDDVVGAATIDRVESVRAAVDRFDDHGIAYDVVDGAGDPGDLVVDVVEEESPDQVVMARGEHSPVGKVVFGSVTQRVMLNVDVPVTVVAPPSS